MNVKLTKNNKINIVTRAREILSSPDNWVNGKLRKSSSLGGYGGFTFCLLGACEQAVYELGLAPVGDDAFNGKPSSTLSAYALGRQLGLNDVSSKKYDRKPEEVNDSLGYGAALELLDAYIEEQKSGAPA